MNMKRYAVFAKKTQAVQRDGDYTIWHFLNDTNDANEALHWYMAAKDHKDYDDVQIVQAIELKAEVQ